MSIDKNLRVLSLCLLAACGGKDSSVGSIVGVNAITKPSPKQGIASCPKPNTNAVAFPPDLANTGIESALGATPGSFAASPSGAATYTIPIVVPPGRAGIEPHLAISYNSDAGESELGMGFALSGLGAVTRCPKTLEPDGENRGVRFDESDNLCLNGARLVSVAGGGHSDPISGDLLLEYRTVPDSFAKVVQHYPVGWTGTKGPQWIEVFTKDGKIVSYGQTADSRETVKGGVVDTWWVSREADRHGNASDYSYTNTLDPTGAMTIVHEPATIAYTSHPTQPANQLVEFVFSDIPNPRTLFRGGAPRKAAKRLTTIRTKSAGLSVRSYWFDYIAGQRTSRALLHTVKECVGAGAGSCKVPTTFQWNSGVESSALVQNGIYKPAFDNLNYNATQDSRLQRWLQDVTGDGLPDIVWSRFNDQDQNEWRVAVNDGTGTFAADTVWFTFPTAIDWVFKGTNWRAQWTDYNHDGRADVLLDVPGATLAQMPTRLLLLATPDHSFEMIDTGTPRIDPGVDQSALRSEVRFMDVDGDGADDLVECANPTLSAAHWSVYMWSPALGGLESTKQAIPQMDGIFCSNMNRSWVHFVDIDGDGVREIVAWPKTGGSYYHAYARVKGVWTDRQLSLQAQHSARRVHFLDTNGDGLPEAVYTGVGQGVDGNTYEGYYDNDGNHLIPKNHPEVVLPFSWTAIQNGVVGTDVVPTGPNGEVFEASDLPVRADNLGGDFVDIDPWYPHSNTFAARPLIDGWWADELADQAQVIDFDGDGLQDLMVPMRYGDPVAPTPFTICQVIWRSDGHGGFSVIRLSQCLPYFDPAGEKPLPGFFQPIVADLNGDGRDDVLSFLKSNKNGTWYTPLLSAGPHDQLIGVIDGTNPLSADDPAVVPTIAITYDALIDRSYPVELTQSTADDVTYLPRFEDGNTCGYPRACVIGSHQVVKRYALNNGKNGVRTFGVQYRDGRADLRGHRGLGFGSRVVRDLDTGAGTASFYDTTTFDGAHLTYPYAGMVKATWTWTPPPPVGVPSLFRADYTQTLFSTIHTTDKQSYFVDPTVQHTYSKTYNNPPLEHGYATAEYMFDDASTHIDERWMIRGVDEYGNVLNQMTNVPMAGVKDSIIRHADIDTETWQIARIDSETSCSAGQCRATNTSFNAFGDPETVSRDASVDPTVGLGVVYTYDAFGHVIYTTSVGAGAVTRTSCSSYDETGTFPFAVGDSLGHVAFSKYDTGLGVVRATVDANGLASQWGYDGFGNVTRTIDTNGVATVITRERFKDGGPSGTWWRNHTWSKTEHGGESESIADAGGRTLRLRRRGPAISTCFMGACTPNPWFAQDTSYDELGRVRSVSTSYLETIAPALRHYTSYVYDNAGHVIEETSPSGHVTETVYTVGTNYAATAIQTKDTMGQTLVYRDAAGRIAEVYDTAGHSTMYEYGPFGALVAVTLPDGTSSTTTVDSWGRVIARSSADRGTTTATFDGFDQMRTEKDAANRGTTHDYDQLGRPVLELHSDETWEYRTYDTANHGIGRLAETSASSGATKAMTYDWAGRVESVTTTIAGTTFTGGTKYDVYGNIETVEYPSALGIGLRLGYDRDVRGNVLAVRDRDSDHVLWTAAELDRRGALTHGVFENNLETWRARDDASGGLTHLWANLGAEPIQDLWLSYDERLRTVGRSKLVAGVSVAEHFDYDALDRLTCSYFFPATIVNGTTACDQGLTYDDVGNITNKSDLGAYTYSGLHPHAVEKAGGLGFGYDDVGNQITRTGATQTVIAYTPFDLPSTYQVDGNVIASLEYDADRQRVRKLTAATDTRYVGALTQQVIDLATKDQREEYYVPVTGATIIVTRRAGAPETRSDVVQDQIGSTDVVVSPTGVERRSYDGWGLRRNPSWNGNNAGPFTSHPTVGFTGQEAEDEVGLINMKGRIYDPTTARFLSTDPHVAVPNSAQSWNPYSYVLNNPLGNVDPSGFDPIKGSGGSITPLSTPTDIIKVNNATEKNNWCASHNCSHLTNKTSGTSTYSSNGKSVDAPSDTKSNHTFTPGDAIIGFGDNLWNQPGDNAEALSGALARWTGSTFLKELAETYKAWNELGKAIRDSEQTEEELTAAEEMAPWVQAAQAAMMAKGGYNMLRGGPLVPLPKAAPEPSMPAPKPMFAEPASPSNPLQYVDKFGQARPWWEEPMSPADAEYYRAQAQAQATAARTAAIREETEAMLKQLQQEQSRPTIPRGGWGEPTLPPPK